MPCEVNRLFCVYYLPCSFYVAYIYMSFWFLLQLSQTELSHVCRFYSLKNRTLLRHIIKAFLFSNLLAAPCSSAQAFTFDYNKKVILGHLWATWNKIHFDELDSNQFKLYDVIKSLSWQSLKSSNFLTLTTSTVNFVTCLRKIKIDTWCFMWRQNDQFHTVRCVQSLTVTCHEQSDKSSVDIQDQHFQVKDLH